jgi:hypothetical protein
MSAFEWRYLLSGEVRHLVGESGALCGMFVWSQAEWRGGSATEVEQLASRRPCGNCHRLAGNR